MIASGEMMKIQVKGIKSTLAEVKKQQLALQLSEKKKLARKYVAQLKQATPVDTGVARDGWHEKDGNIINEVPYIDALNNGHSEQAPSLFIEKTLLSNPEVKPRGLIVSS